MPLVFVTIWGVSMEYSSGSDTIECSGSGSLSEDSCWSGWSQSPHLFYLIAAPMLLAYAVSSLWMTSSFASWQFSDQLVIFAQYCPHSGVQTAGGQHSQRGPSQVIQQLLIFLLSFLSVYLMSIKTILKFLLQKAVAIIHSFSCQIYFYYIYIFIQFFELCNFSWA